MHLTRAAGLWGGAILVFVVFLTYPLLFLRELWGGVCAVNSTIYQCQSVHARHCASPSSPTPNSVCLAGDVSWYACSNGQFLCPPRWSSVELWGRSRPVLESEVRAPPYRERIFIELMTSCRELKASREGSK